MQHKTTPFLFSHLTVKQEQIDLSLPRCNNVKKHIVWQLKKIDSIMLLLQKGFLGVSKNLFSEPSAIPTQSSCS